MSSSEQCSTEFLNVIISESDLYCPPHIYSRSPAVGSLTRDCRKRVVGENIAAVLHRALLLRTGSSGLRVDDDGGAGGREGAPDPSTASPGTGGRGGQRVAALGAPELGQCHLQVRIRTMASRTRRRPHATRS